MKITQHRSNPVDAPKAAGAILTPNLLDPPQPSLEAMPRHTSLSQEFEVIDVDSLEEEDFRPIQRQRLPEPRARSPEVIELLDSDDEFSMWVNGSSGPNTVSTSMSNGERSRTGTIPPPRRYISPPPPPTAYNNVPPVPSLPPRFQSFASFPGPVHRSRHPAPVPSGSTSRNPIPAPIRPFEQDFDFQFASPPRQTSPRPAAVPPRRAFSPEFRHAPAARHNPPMGFGGALISTNNARLEAERAERQRRMDRRLAGGRVAPGIAQPDGGRSGLDGWHAVNHNVGYMQGMANTNPFRWGGEGAPVNQVNVLALGQLEDADTRTQGDAQLALDLFLADAEHGARADMAHLRRWAIFRPPREEDKYKKEWTHPRRLDPGFISDFSPSDALSGVVEDHGKGKAKEEFIDVDAENDGGPNVLLVCVKCLEPLSMCSELSIPEDELRKRRVWGLRCGHVIDGKCVDLLRIPQSAAEPQTAAAEQPDQKEPDEQTEDDGDAGGLIPAPIASRLRHRATLGVPTNGTSRRASAQRAKAKAKPKGRQARKPVVEVEFTWDCPVESCRRKHVTQRIAGQWINPPDTGAIPMFV
ncbi:unnamed protein product [Mycena citricolor]|uniref:Uncharacterized protein n=1 Tax=Mycena citricolor TaxID=2018698 RepID=A0AAD2HKL9_9AGAR|nr:unnamed protein product [Mycena citricolor]